MHVHAKGLLLPFSTSSSGGMWKSGPSLGVVYSIQIIFKQYITIKFVTDCNRILGVTVYPICAYILLNKFPMYILGDYNLNPWSVHHS